MVLFTLLKLIVSLPFLLLAGVTSIVFGIIGLILWPISCCCPCIQGLLDFIEFMVLLPVNLFLWVID